MIENNSEFQPRGNAENANPAREHILNFLGAVADLQTDENASGNGWYKKILHQNDAITQGALALSMMFGVPGVSVKSVNRREHEVQWSPSMLQDFLHR
ncbi:MAG: hypothetical protein QG639_733 [Patescibacteria group bacterium]|jgi:hypothetical protein|nr:hypothetical protein [Patescibacteria group bacterium]